VVLATAVRDHEVLLTALRGARRSPMSYGPAWPNLKQAVKGMREIIELAKAGRLPPLDEPPPTA